MAGNDCAYMGSYDENSKRSGNGVAVYPGGYLYIGEYKDGVRSGQGLWYYPSGSGYFTGAWANDAPNGYGEVWGSDLGGSVNGEHLNGLENGEMTYQIIRNAAEALFHYTATNGRIPIMETGSCNGKPLYVIAYNEKSTKPEIIFIMESDEICGISPWCSLTDE